MSYNLNLSVEKLHVIGAITALYEEIHFKTHNTKKNFNLNKIISNLITSLVYYSKLQMNTWEDKRLQELVDKLAPQDLPIALTSIQIGNAMLGYYHERNRYLDKVDAFKLSKEKQEKGEF
ncbi:hypothetical protein G7B40_041815 [Aetokthonos hydrillicola Thurmond2011]|uniref:Uncharacterized protein n=1 Tax=Aetokthonos hydrillicola Thurmond2011 TaxID=2712845 RepID=A0AAP5IGV7_9CYAN|nr:hypothetical protein [Aetokthonos hydrillicola]MDR9900952.1 hypothetical protein [Aetokthonos hydrillicola Thurmond2011]